MRIVEEEQNFSRYHEQLQPVRYSAGSTEALLFIYLCWAWTLALFSHSQSSNSSRNARMDSATEVEVVVRKIVDQAIFHVIG